MRWRLERSIQGISSAAIWLVEPKEVPAVSERKCHLYNNTSFLLVVYSHQPEFEEVFAAPISRNRSVVGAQSVALLRWHRGDMFSGRDIRLAFRCTLQVMLVAEIGHLSHLHIIRRTLCRSFVARPAIRCSGCARPLRSTDFSRDACLHDGVVNVS